MAVLDLAPVPSAPAEARRFVRGELANCPVGRDTREDVELLVTELVTNAVIHARSDIRLEVSYGASGVHVTVSDATHAPVRLRTPSADSVTGRGIYVLDQLADHWAVEYGAQGKTVSFTISDGTEPVVRHG